MARVSESRQRIPPSYLEVAPESRTIGQSIGAGIRAYGDNFWRALLLAIVPVLPAAAGIAAHSLGVGYRVVVPPTIVLIDVTITLAFAAAAAVVGRARLTARSAAVALAAGLTALIPAHLVVLVGGLIGGVAVAVLALVLLAPVWLALLGLAVPAAVLEGLGYRDALRRARVLAQVDFRHLWGAMTTLAVVCLAGFLMLLMLLVNTSRMDGQIAQPITAIVMLPLLLFGGAVLYQDQVARESHPAGHPPRGAAPDPARTPRSGEGERP
ncbi:MAG: hypothetical protein ACXVZ1_06005 [Gaiellaceae bacterium]